MVVRCLCMYSSANREVRLIQKRCRMQRIKATLSLNASWMSVKSTLSLLKSFNPPVLSVLIMSRIVIFQQPSYCQDLLVFSSSFSWQVSPVEPPIAPPFVAQSKQPDRLGKAHHYPEKDTKIIVKSRHSNIFGRCHKNFIKVSFFLTT